MSKSILNVKNVYGIFLQGLKKYPFTYFFSFALFIFWELVIYEVIKKDNIIFTYFLFLVFNIIWSAFAETIQNKKYKYIILFSGIALNLLFLIFNLSEVKIALKGTFVALYFSAILIAFLLFITIYTSSKDNNTFWEKIMKAIYVFVITSVFTVVLTLGISLALSAIFFLVLGGKFTDEFIKLQLGVINLIYSFIFPTLLLSFSVSPPNVNFKNNFTRIFLGWIFVPLSWFYLIILYLYFGKILLTGVIPKNGIAWWVIIFWTYGLLTYILSYPFSKKENLFLRGIPKPYFYLAIPLVGLLFFSILYRVHFYGWTPSRYFALAGGIYVLIVSLWILFSKNFKLINLLYILVAMLIISNFFPFINAYSVSYKSQTNRLKKLFTENKDKIKSGTLSYKTAKEITDRLRFFKNWYAEIDTTIIPEEHRKLLVFKKGLLKDTWKLENYIYDHAEKKTTNKRYFSYSCDAYDSKPVSLPKPVKKIIGKFTITNYYSSKNIAEYKIKNDTSGVLYITKGTDTTQWNYREFIKPFKAQKTETCPVVLAENYVIVINYYTIYDNKLTSMEITIYE